MKDFHRLLKESTEVHGHMCPGQVIGIRMALLGCNLIGLNHPQKEDQIKKLIVYVEIDRCAADAIALATGAKLGRRSLKFMDYGIMAASFIHLESREAFRVISTEESREMSSVYAPEYSEKSQQQFWAYQRMPDKILFKVQEVSIPLSDYDFPGPTKRKAVCFGCGQVVRDHKEINKNGFTFCKPCAQGAYFKNVDDMAI